MTNKWRIIGQTFIFLAAITVCMVSCSRVPKHILSEKKMRSVLYDMQLAEAFVETNSESYRTSDERRALYEKVFAKHRITQAVYDSTLVWYGEHMDLYMQVYKLVLKDIEKTIAATSANIKPNPLSGEASAKDSIDVWIYGRSHTFKPERVFNTLIFDIKPQQPYSSGSSFVLGMSVWGVSPSWNHKPEIVIRAAQADTVITVRRQIAGDGYYEMAVKTAATKQVERVYGYIIFNETDAAYHRIYLDNISLMKYNYGSKAITAPRDSALHVNQ